MKRTNKWIAVFSAAALMMTGAMMLPVEANAWDYNWTLEGESTVDNHVYRADGTEIVNSIQTNYHVGGLDGVICGESFSDMCSLLDITDKMVYDSYRPVLYVAPSYNGDKAVQLIKDTMAPLGGTWITCLDIQLFRTDTTWNEPIKNTTSPVMLIVGIQKQNRDKTYAYGLVQLLDGKTSIYYDTDSDNATATFDTSSFEGSYTLFRYPATNTPATSTNATTTTTPAGNTQPTANAGDYDDVPKTGDISVPMALGHIGACVIWN